MADKFGLLGLPLAVFLLILDLVCDALLPEPLSTLTL